MRRKSRARNNLRNSRRISVSYTHLRAHETGRNLVCRLLLEKKIEKVDSQIYTERAKLFEANKKIIEENKKNLLQAQEKLEIAQENLFKIDLGDGEGSEVIGGDELDFDNVEALIDKRDKLKDVLEKQIQGLDGYKKVVAPLMSQLANLENNGMHLELQLEIFMQSTHPGEIKKFQKTNPGSIAIAEGGFAANAIKLSLSLIHI